MIEVLSLFFLGLSMHLPCLLAVGMCGLGCRLCAAKHRFKFIVTALFLIGAYAGAHYYEYSNQDQADPLKRANSFFCRMG